MNPPPRDTVCLSTHPRIADAMRRKGYYAVHVGSEGCPDANYLRENWSRITCRNPSAFVVGPQELGALVERLCFQTQINNNTGARRSRRWVEALLRNVRHLAEHPTALSLAGRLHNTPAFIVGAGPSLSKNAHLMAEARNRGVVISVNSASRVVHGQVVLTVESNPIMAKVQARDSAKVYAITADARMLTDGSGPFLPIWTGEIGWVCDRLTGLQRIAVSGSGTTAAVSLAHLWGCAPIVLVGQDLAYTDGRVYAPETGFAATVDSDGALRWDALSKSLPRPENPLPEREDLTEVFGWAGGSVMSGPMFINVIGWLASAAESCAADGIECINATEGGARVPLWRSKALSSVLAALPERHVSAKELRLMAGAPPVSRERLEEWLRTEAADQLLEPWAMPRVRAALDKFRERRPLRPPLLEALARRRFDRQIARIERECRAELGRMCG